MRVLVTGGLGFLGSAVVRALSAAGHEAVATDRHGPHACDITDTTAVHDLVRTCEPEVVVHLAVLLTPESRRDIVAAAKVNALGTANIAQAALAAGSRVRRIVYASSIAAIGEPDPSRGDAAWLRPQSVYGATKAFAEHLFGALAPDHPAVTFIGLRYGWVFGPGRDRGWRDVQAMIEAAADGAPEVTYPAMTGAMDWTFVDDAAQVALAAVSRPLAPGHHVLNVAGDTRPIEDAVAHLSRRFPGTRFVRGPALNVASVWGLRNDRLSALLGFAPSTPMEEAIDRLIASRRPSAQTP